MKLVTAIIKPCEICRGSEYRIDLVLIVKLESSKIADEAL
jgi:RNA polymerase subunit RPABC4/transcription elongation factor Spt4